jgi:hypothetical protein
MADFYSELLSLKYVTEEILKNISRAINSIDLYKLQNNYNFLVYADLIFGDFYGLLNLILHTSSVEGLNFGKTDVKVVSNYLGRFVLVNRLDFDRKFSVKYFLTENNGDVYKYLIDFYVNKRVVDNVYCVMLDMNKIPVKFFIFKNCSIIGISDIKLETESLGSVDVNVDFVYDYLYYDELTSSGVVGILKSLLL